MLAQEAYSSGEALKARRLVVAEGSLSSSGSRGLAIRASGPVGHHG